MAEGDLHDVSSAIGRLEEGMRFLSRQVQVNQERTIEEHKLVYAIVTASAESIRVITATVAEMKALTDDYREKRAEARGAARLIHAVYAAAGGTVAIIGSEAIRLFSHRGG